MYRDRFKHARAAADGRPPRAPATCHLVFEAPCPHCGRATRFDPSQGDGYAAARAVVWGRFSGQEHARKPLVRCGRCGKTFAFSQITLT